MNHPRTLLFLWLEFRHAELPQQVAPLVGQPFLFRFFGAADAAMAALILDAQQDRFAARRRGLKLGRHFCHLPGIHARVVETGLQQDGRVRSPLFDMVISILA
jgi:hypothetical protein